MGTLGRIFRLPVGFRFHPTDQELVSHYLEGKLKGDDSSVNIIPELDLCNVEPWEVPALIKTDEPEWFFFSPLDYKYAAASSGSKRFNRATRHGFWKGTGNDCDIKKTGTNNVIGIKKILVFYEGRSPGFKTNWVIHEFHAASATSDNAQRRFVLCRLMNKALKQAQGGSGTVALTSRHMAPDYVNEAAAEGIQDVHGILPGVNRDSIIRTWHQEQSHNHNAYFRNENSSRQTPFEFTYVQDIGPDVNNESILQTLHQGDRYVPSNQQTPVIFDQEVFLPATEGRRDALVKDSTQPLRRIYYESSDTDAEVVSALCCNILDATTVLSEHPSSGGYHASKMYKSSHGSALGETKVEKNDSTSQDDFRGVKASSCDSSANKSLKINCIEISGSPSPRKWKYQYPAKPFISQRATVRNQYQTPEKLSGNAVSHLEMRKPGSCTNKGKKPEKDHMIARDSSSKENSETRSHQSSNVNSKGSFIFPEAPSSSQSLFLCKVLFMCFMLFIVINWELLSS